MKIAGLLLFCLAPVSTQSGQLPQTDTLVLKSQRAKQLMAEGKFGEAIPLYRELNQAVPNNPGLKLNLGMALHMAGKKREAIPELEAAVKLKPDLTPAWLFLGTSHLQLGETTAAIKAFMTVLGLQSEIRGALQMLAEALFSLGRLEEASEQYKRLAEVYPERP